MPGKTIFRRLNKPAKDYLSKAADMAVIDVDSTESQSSHTEIMSIDSKKDEKHDVVTATETTSMTVTTTEDAFSSNFSSSDKNNNNIMCSTPVTPEPSEDGFGATGGGDISINQKPTNDIEKQVDDKTEKVVTVEAYNKVVDDEEGEEEKKEQELSNSQQQQQQQQNLTGSTLKSDAVSKCSCNYRY